MHIICTSSLASVAKWNCTVESDGKSYCTSCRHTLKSVGTHIPKSWWKMFHNDNNTCTCTTKRRSIFTVHCTQNTQMYILTICTHMHAYPTKNRSSLWHAPKGYRDIHVHTQKHTHSACTCPTERLIMFTSTPKDYTSYLATCTNIQNGNMQDRNIYKWSFYSCVSFTGRFIR